MDANKRDVLKLVTTTEGPISAEEEDAIVTLVVIVICIIVTIIVIFSMGIFLDCKHQNGDSLNRKKIKLKMPLNSRNKRTPKPEDAKSFATEMCPNGASETGFNTGDIAV